MKTATFKDWDLTSLDEAFGLAQIIENKCEVLQNWLQEAKAIVISEAEKQIIFDLQEPLTWGGKSWNEVELENKFISPLIMTTKIDDRIIGYFLERPLKGVVGEYELSGIVDGMIATGFRDPHKPFFCMHEYKRSVDNQGTPDAQALAAMLVVQEKNGNDKPIYDMYIVGLIWNFMVLNGKEYAVSQDYKAGDEEVFDIFRMLKALKKIIIRDLL